MGFLLTLQNIRNPFLDALCKIFTLMGEDTFIVAFICFCFWCYNKKLAYKAGFVFCSALGINQILKISFCVPRPWVLNPSVTPSPLAVETATGYSFPSGHTQTASVFFPLAAFHFRRTAVTVLSVICVMGVAFSRMYFGVHTPADVLVSIIIGIILVCLAQAAEKRINGGNFITYLFCAFSVLFLIFVIIRLNYGNADYEMAEDCFKAAGAMAGFCLGRFLEMRYIDFKTTGSRRKKAVRYISGISGLVVLKLLTKCLPQTMLVYFAANFLLILWCITIYPFIAKKMKI